MIDCIAAYYFLAFLVAGLVRVATGSATVAGSLMVSHVNDAGIWLVREYMGLTVKETFKTWAVMETILTFVAFVFVLTINAFV